MKVRLVDGWVCRSVLPMFGGGLETNSVATCESVEPTLLLK